MRGKVKEIQGLRPELDSLAISGGSESPSTTWLYANDIARIPLAANLVIDAVAADMPTGVTIKYFTHGVYTLTVLGETDFISRDGEYKVAVENIGTPASPVYRITDAWKSYGAGGLEKTDPLVLDYTDIQDLFTTPQTLKTASGEGIMDNVFESWVYVDADDAYTGSTVLNLLSGTTIMGTCDCLGETVSGWHKFTLNENIPEENAALTVQAASSDPLTGTGNIGLITYYDSLNQNIFIFPAFPTSELLYDDFPTGAIDTTTKWDLANPGSVNISPAQVADKLLVTAHTTSPTTAGDDSLRSKVATDAQCAVAIDIVSHSAYFECNFRVGIYVDASNYVAFYMKDATGVMSFRRRVAAVSTNFHSTIPAVGNRFRITQDASHRIRYWYYDSGWTELDAATDKTHNLGTGKKGIIDFYNSSGGTSPRTMEFDRFRFDNDDTYTTELP